MRNNLWLRTIATSVIGLIVFGVLLFVPAGTIAYWQGWLFTLVFSISTQAIGIYLARRDPALLARRLQAGPTAEQRTSQRVISAMAFGSFAAVMVFSALDHRFGWSPVPTWLSLVGDGLVAVGLYINFLALRENTYSASNIRVEQGQTVVSTGPYAVARHPIYAGALVMVVGLPLALDSWLGLLALVVTIPVLVWRILDEEELLNNDLPGYANYAQRVRFRLVPLVW
jgi:protein-S-isoprenylcysteine O-methyltransferase Ste14